MPFLIPLLFLGGGGVMGFGAAELFNSTMSKIAFWVAVLAVAYWFFFKKGRA